MKRILLAALILMAVGPLTWAADKDPNELNDPNYPSDPAQLVQVKWDAIINILRNKDLDEQKKADKISKIVSPVFDFPLMGKLAIGRTHWPKLSESQRDKYIRLFTERLKVSYREKVSLYTNETVEYKKVIKQKNGTVHVPTELVSADRKTSIVYKLRKTGKRWKVYDVTIQKVSILLTYRSQFDDILRRGSVDDLLERLEMPSSKTATK